MKNAGLVYGSVLSVFYCEKLCPSALLDSMILFLFVIFIVFIVLFLFIFLWNVVFSAEAAVLSGHIFFVFIYDNFPVLYI